MSGTKLIGNIDGKEIVLELDAGDAVIFRGDFIHSGAEYTNKMNKIKERMKTGIQHAKRQGKVDRINHARECKKLVLDKELELQKKYYD